MEKISITNITPYELKELIQETIQKAFDFNKRKDLNSESDERLTRKQVCDKFKISAPTLHKEMHNGLPFEKIGRKTVFRRADLDNYFQQKGRSAKS